MDMMKQNNEPLLELRALTKEYGRGIALSGVDLSVRSGELVALLGPSGSGKSTVLSLIAGFQVPSSGKILLRGQDISRLAPGQRELGVVFQNYALFPHMTIAENVGYPLKLRGWDAVRRRKRVAEVLELVRLKGHEAKRPRQLSGGQQQRAALARVLSFEPPLLLMDEPLSALDREIRGEMKAEIRRIHRKLGTTILYVTHDREEALALSDRVAILRGGHLVTVHPPRELFREPVSAFVARFFSGHNILPIAKASAEDDGRARILLGSGEVVVRSTVRGSGIRTCLALPPHNVRLQPEPGMPSLPARVVDVANLGHETEITFLINSETQIVGRFPYAAKIPNPGNAIDIFLSPDGAVLVEDDIGSGPVGSVELRQRPQLASLRVGADAGGSSRERPHRAI
jgi:putative spermidine/putrescine transport system ATP-binding protein